VVLILDLGYGDVEPMLHPFDYRFGNLPLALEGIVLSQAQLHYAGTDMHRSLQNIGPRKITLSA